MTAVTRTTPRFHVGDHIRVDDRDILGHCRTPRFLRGRIGVIADMHGSYRDPEQLAYRRPGLPEQILYKVRFRLADIWQNYQGPVTDTLDADLYEHWLQPAKGR